MGIIRSMLTYVLELKKHYEEGKLSKAEYVQLDRGECTSPAALSRYLQVSRARVTQVLNLLKLALEVVEMISSLGDPLGSSFISERRLRPFLKLNTEKQAKKIRIMLSG